MPVSQVSLCIKGRYLCEGVRGVYVSVNRKPVTWSDHSVVSNSILYHFSYLLLRLIVPHPGSYSG
jgi:hypothetical protein